MVGCRGVLVLLTVPRKLVLGAIARPMSRLLILIVGLVGVLREPGVVGAVTVAPMLVVAIHAVPLFAIPTAAIIISVASPISCTPSPQHKSQTCIAPGQLDQPDPFLTLNRRP